MGLIKELLDLATSGGKKDAVASAEASLSRLHDDRRKAEDVIDGGLTRRRQLLLDDAPDSAIAELDDEIDAARLLLERLELAEPVLQEKLAVGRDVRRRAQWQEFEHRAHEAALAYIMSLKNAADNRQRYLSANEEARRAGFEAESNSYLPPVFLHPSADELERWHFDCERMHDSALSAMDRHKQKPPGPLAQSPPPQPAPSTKPVPTGPKLVALEPSPIVTKNKRAAIKQAPCDGKVLVRMLRGGLETQEGLQTVLGDIIAIPPSIAEQVVRNSAGEYYDEPDKESA